MKGQLKMAISTLIDIVIVVWREKGIKSGLTGHQLEIYLRPKYQSLIRIVIELQAMIKDPIYLCNEIYHKFLEEGKDKARQFLDELRFYILTGMFADWDTAPEHILNFNILQPYQIVFQED